jgi:hypothetical protein
VSSPSPTDFDKGILFGLVLEFRILWFPTAARGREGSRKRARRCGALARSCVAGSRGCGAGSCSGHGRRPLGRGGRRRGSTSPIPTGPVVATWRRGCHPDTRSADCGALLRGEKAVCGHARPAVVAADGRRQDHAARSARADEME